MALEISGHGVLWLSAPLIYFYGYPTMSPCEFAALLHFCLLLLFDIVAIAILKPLVHRRRPLYDSGTQLGTVARIDQFSFPSGHATRAISIAVYTFFAAYAHPECLPDFCRLPGLKTLLAVWSLAVSASRVALGRHHFLDVMFGLVLGCLYVCIIERLWLADNVLVQAREILTTRIGQTVLK